MRIPQQQIFEVVPELGVKLGSLDSVLDSDHPRIANTLAFLWGSREFLEEVEWMLGYVHTSDRPTRQGFSIGALRELQALLEIHMEKFPLINTEYTMGIRNGFIFY